MKNRRIRIEIPIDLAVTMESRFGSVEKGLSKIIKKLLRANRMGVNHLSAIKNSGQSTEKGPEAGGSIRKHEGPQSYGR